LPHLEPPQYRFKLQASNQSGYCICSLAKGLTPWRRRHEIVDDHSVCGMSSFQGYSLIQHCEGKGDEYHTATAFYLRTLIKKGMGLTQAAVHHGKNDQSRKTVVANKQISGQYYQPLDSQESDHVNKVNENVENKAGDIVGDLVVYDDLEMNDASSSIEQEYQCDIGASDYDIDSDEPIDVENQAKDVQSESIFADSSEMKDASMLSEQELPVHCTHASEEVNTVDKATDANGDPSKDSDHKIDAENMTVDEPDCTLDSVEVNTVDKANDANGHPSQDSDVTIDAKNSNVDELDIIHDSSKTNDANAEQTESMVDDDVEDNDVSQNIIQGLQNKTACDDVEMEKADKTTDAFGHVSKDCDDIIDEENTIIDQGTDLSIQDGVEMIDATPMEGGSVNIGEQNIVQDGLTFMQEQLTSDFNNNDDQASIHEEVKYEDYGIGGSSDSSEIKYDSSDSSVKQSTKHIKEKSKKKFTIPFDEDSDDKSEGHESGNSRFSQTSLKEQQGEPELPIKKTKQKTTFCMVEKRNRRCWCTILGRYCK
jgi:hypothetical protein